jgi:hypothetical protein
VHGHVRENQPTQCRHVCLSRRIGATDAARARTALLQGLVDLVPKAASVVVPVVSLRRGDEDTEHVQLRVICDLGGDEVGLPVPARQEGRKGTVRMVQAFHAILVGVPQPKMGIRVFHSRVAMSQYAAPYINFKIRYQILMSTTRGACLEAARASSTRLNTAMIWEPMLSAVRPCGMHSVARTPYRRMARVPARVRIDTPFRILTSQPPRMYTRRIVPSP